MRLDKKRVVSKEEKAQQRRQIEAQIDEMRKKNPEQMKNVQITDELFNQCMSMSAVGTCMDSDTPVAMYNVCINTYVSDESMSMRAVGTCDPLLIYAFMQGRCREGRNLVSFCINKAISFTIVVLPAGNILVSTFTRTHTQTVYMYVFTSISTCTYSRAQCSYVSTSAFAHPIP